MGARPGMTLARDTLLIMSSSFFLVLVFLFTASPTSQASVPVNPQPVTPEELYNQAIALEDSGDSTGAMALYTRAIAIAPEFEMAYVNRSSIYADQKRNRSAIRDLKIAIKLDPSDWMAWNNLGNDLSAVGRYSRAVSAFNRALALKPDSPNIWGGRGHAWEKLGHLRKAEADFGKAIEASHNTSAEEFANRGLMRVKQGKFELGKRDLQLALRLDPSQPIAKKVLSLLEHRP